MANYSCTGSCGLTHSVSGAEVDAGLTSLITLVRIS